MKCILCWQNKQSDKTSQKDKLETYQALKDDSVQRLVATKVFGMGINFSSICHIIHVGLPENLSLWIQESGRAGRDGEPSHAHPYINDFQDVKKLGYWTREMDISSDGRVTRHTDFLHVYKYICTNFLESVFENFSTLYFDDDDRRKKEKNLYCCSGCNICSSYKLKVGEELRTVLQIPVFLLKKGINAT